MDQKKVLHFEDEKVLADLYKVKLEKAGYDYIWYSNPPAKDEELLELVLKENPDVILMDVIMPVMDGYTASKVLKADKRTEPIPIVGLSNLATKEDIQLGLDYGMTSFFTKAELDPADLAVNLKKSIK